MYGVFFWKSANAVSVDDAALVLYDKEIKSLATVQFNFSIELPQG